jgi:phage anti-repressor protein
MSNTTTQNTTQKIAISAAEFQKKVEIEAENLKYFNYMRKGEAFTKAQDYVSQKYVVATASVNA